MQANTATEKVPNFPIIIVSLPLLVQTNYELCELYHQRWGVVNELTRVVKGYCTLFGRMQDQLSVPAS